MTWLKLNSRMPPQLFTWWTQQEQFDKVAQVPWCGAVKGVAASCSQHINNMSPILWVMLLIHTNKCKFWASRRGGNILKERYNLPHSLGDESCAWHSIQRPRQPNQPSDGGRGESLSHLYSNTPQYAVKHLTPHRAKIFTIQLLSGLIDPGWNTYNPYTTHFNFCCCIFSVTKFNSTEGIG